MSEFNLVSCNGCDAMDEEWEGKPSQHPWARADYHGIYTGIYCDECYDSDRYPYKKYNYESELNYGERIDDDY